MIKVFCDPSIEQCMIGCAIIVCLVECWTLADKSQRNAGVSESVGRSGDLSLAGDGEVTMAMVESWSTL